MKNKIKKQIMLGTLASLAIIGVPVATAVSCGSTDSTNSADFIANNIVWYYDKSSPTAYNIAKEAKTNFEKMQDKAIKDGKMTSKVKVVLKEADDKYKPTGDMVNLWGYNDIKSPDIFFAEAKSINMFHTKSGKQMNHLFKEKEYDSFWKMAQFGENDNKNIEITYPFDASVGKVRASLPWFPKSFFLYTNSGQTGKKVTDSYDPELNTRLAVKTDVYGKKLNTNDPDPVVLGTSSVMQPGKKAFRENPVGADYIDVKNTIGAFNNTWQPVAFVAPILDYIRGGYVDTTHANGLDTSNGHTMLNRAKFGRRNSDGYSNTVGDFAFLPHVEKNQLTKSTGGAVVLKDDTKIKRQSIAFGNKNLKSAIGNYDQYVANGEKPSETLTAMYSMLMDPQAKTDYQQKSDQTALARTIQPKIASLGFQSLFSKFKYTTGAPDLSGTFLSSIISRAFMGAPNKYSDAKKGIDLEHTAPDNHKFSAMIAAGIDWPKFMKSNLTDGGGLGKKLGSDKGASLAERNKILKSYNIYRMPQEWKLDNGDNNGINLFDGKTVRKVTSLDGVQNDSIPAFDKKPSYLDIVAPYDEDSLHFNERNWEIPDKAKRANKVYALKLFVASLYGVQTVNENFNPAVDKPSINLAIAKSLRDDGTFSAKSTLFEAALTKPTNWDSLTETQRLDTDNMEWADEVDRLWYETYLAFDKIPSPQVGDPRVDNDAQVWGATWWDEQRPTFALDASRSSTFNPYSAAKWTSDTIKSGMQINNDKPKSWGTPRDQI